MFSLEGLWLLLELESPSLRSSKKQTAFFIQL
jgi:hypothetical protein